MENHKIVILKGPDRIRKRPAVIFGLDDIAGVKNAVTFLLEMFATETQLGHCKTISIKQTGALLEISSDDRGLYLGQDVGDDSVWKNIFCEMFPASAFPPDDGDYTYGLVDPAHHLLYGDKEQEKTIMPPEEPCFLELYALQCASRFMDVMVVRDGLKSTLHFQKGYNVGGIQNEKTSEASGTCFRFEMDKEVFTETVIPNDFFLDILRCYAILCPGLKCTYTNMESHEEVGFCYPGGIAQYVGQGESVPVYSKEVTAKGKDRYNRAEYEACVQLAMAVVPENGNLLCLHNYRNLTKGGTHCDALKERICHAFLSAFRVEFEGKEEPTFEELQKHLQVVLVSWCSPRCSDWENGTRQSICNRMITDMTYDISNRDLENHVYSNRESYRSIILKILKNR